MEAFLYSPWGKQIGQIKKRDFKDRAAVDGFSLYLDDRVLYHEHVPVQYPYTLEFIYEVETSDTGAFPSRYFVPAYGIGVEQSSFSIRYPSNVPKPVVKERNLDHISLERLEEPGLIHYTAKGIPALSREPLSPPFQEFAPWVGVRLPSFHYKGQYAQVDDWGDMGLWLQQLFQGRDRLDPTRIRAMENLVHGVDDPMEKAKIVHKYVQDNTRYVSVQMGIGGIQPISALEVDRDRYGDCKGLTNYTQALLKTVGVESHYAVVQAGRTKIDLQEDFPTLAQGNHVILGIPRPEGYHWLDCTSQVHPFGYIGDFTDDRKVLVVTPGGGEIVATKAYLNEENYIRTEADLKVLRDLSMEGELVLESGGVAYNDRFALERGDQREVKEHYSHLWDHIPGLSILEYNFLNDREKVVFREALSLSSRNYMAKKGEAFFLVPNAFNKDTRVPPRSWDRSLPFVIQRGYVEETLNRVEIPEDLQVSKFPEKYSLDTQFGSYSVEVLADGQGALIYKRRLFLKAGTYPKELYPDYRAFLGAVVQRDGQQIILTKKP